MGMKILQFESIQSFHSTVDIAERKARIGLTCTVVWFGKEEVETFVMIATVLYDF